MYGLHKFLYFPVYQLCSLLAVRLGEVIPARTCRVIERQVSDLFTHTVISDHAVCHLGQPLKIVQGSCRRLAVNNLLSHTSADKGAHLINHLFLGNQLSLLWKIPRRSESLSARDYRHLEKRIRMRKKPAYCGMAGLMMCNRALLGRSYYLGFSLKASDYPVNGIKEILFVNRALVMPCRSKRSLIADIRYVSAGKARSMLGKELKIKVISQLETAEMHLENLFPLLKVRKFHMYLPVETSCPQKRLVQNVRPVGGCKYDDPGI